MDIPNGVIKDRRSVSRVMAHLGCHFAFGGFSHQATIKDMSLKGAFLWSIFLPPIGGNVSIILDTPLLKNILILEGKVVRTDCGLPDHGKGGGFAVTFSHSSVNLIELINKLISRSNVKEADKVPAEEASAPLPENSPE